MMTIERAIATVANHQGHSRETILEAAQVLRLHVPTSHGLTARETVQEEQRQTCGKLLLAMSDAMLRVLTTTHNLDGCNGGDYHFLWGQLRDAKILFASTLDRS